MSTRPFEKLSDEQIAEKLAVRDGWNFSGGQIHKVYEFESYATGLSFASAVGFIADAMDHHPDLIITWRKVEVRLSTHDVSGVSELDLQLADNIDRFIRK